MYEGTYLLETTKFIDALEGTLNFEKLIGDSQSIATESVGEAIKERLAKIGTAIKTFFEKLFAAITKWFKDNITGETMIEISAVTEIKSLIRDFMAAYDDETRVVVKAIESNSEIPWNILRVDNVLDHYEDESNEIIENIHHLKEGSKINKDKLSKSNAIPIKECQNIIETTYNTLKVTTNKVYQLTQNKLEDAATVNELAGPYNRYINMRLARINKLYNLLFKIMTGGKVHYSAHAK
jgi:hypothetical protein